MRVDDGQPGFEGGFLAPVQPILAHRAWGAGCCADAVSGKAAAALPRKAMNSRLLIVASLIRCGDLISFASIARRRRAAMAACVVRRARDAPVAPCDKGYTRRDVRKGRTMMNRRQFLCAYCRVVRLRWLRCRRRRRIVIKGGLNRSSAVLDTLTNAGERRGRCAEELAPYSSWSSLSEHRRRVYL